MGTKSRKVLIGLCLPATAAAMLLTFGLAGWGTAAAMMQGGTHVCLVDDDQFATVSSGCKDLATGLVWSTEAGGGFEQNLARCESMDEGGFTDWRVPTLAELEAAHLNGAPTHFEYCCTGTNIEHWSDRKTGNWEWAFGLMTHGFANKHFAPSSLRGACVREAASACGDGTCDAGENRCNCPGDCGAWSSVSSRSS